MRVIFDVFVSGNHIFEHYVFVMKVFQGLFQVLSMKMRFISVLRKPGNLFALLLRQLPTILFAHVYLFFLTSWPGS